ncbi:hypothetical protein ABBQ38_002658 [Trebouxia sp. C0009 RCD-2024]
MTAACCPCESMAELGTPRPLPWVCARAASSVPPCLASSLMGCITVMILETAAPRVGVQIQHMRLKELVYADDTCLMASSPEQLQALIDALAAYCATLHMEISVPKTKVMVVADAFVAPVLFT